MTLKRVQYLYKITGYVVAGLSLMVILIQFEGSAIQERIWEATLMNVGYHMLYYLTNTGPLIQLNWLKDNSTTKFVARQFFLVMSYHMIVASVLAATGIIYGALVYNNYRQLFALALLPGMILGAIKLNIRLKKNNKRTTTMQQKQLPSL